ncbi:hypothetical protein PAECIP111891_02143 [Paenibacillus allorhizoplanae]|uniref:beta-N-acetylhexosaminidase n=1 Tax=Paenibacillus allorhizoplanae TaxID=2905648 RepID=A0ABM9C4Q7_9BACL|nr:family 20 glycosylhydrolase [Paenibacillus allorhizoplanae]CAH1202322.1 hypothetical protein PAECIP111891_02143 [Paenibacillus allorhizoplanae]
MQIIPKINGSVTKSELYLMLDSQFEIHAGSFNPSIVEIFIKRVSEHCQINGNVSGNRSANIQLIADLDGNIETYSVEIGVDGIRLYAQDDAGMTWALTSLYQMIVEAQKTNDGKLMCTTFKDGPKYAHRGLLIDVARHFFGVEEMKKIIEEMSLYKLNVLHWHLTDDQAWRIESKIFPKLNEIGSFGNYYTHDQIREVVAFAASRGVEIVPEIDMPGHASAAIAAYPELSCFDEQIQITGKAGIYKVIMCAGKETTYEWIYQLMDEITALFPSERIHLGGDESPKEKWKACPHCKESMIQNEIDNFEELQGIFTGKVADYLKLKGKTVTCWNESLKAERISKDIAVQYWIEAEPQSYVYPHFEKGQPMIFSEVFHMYFDYPYSIVRLKKTYEYEPKIRENLNLKGDNILGIEGAIWTERVPTSEILEAMISPRIQALAEAAWTVDRNYEDFLVRLKAHVNYLGLSKLGSTPLEEATIHGEQAKEQAISFLQSFMGMMSSPDVELELSPEELKGMAVMFITNIFDEETAAQMLKSLGF